MLVKKNSKNFHKKKRQKQDNKRCNRKWFTTYRWPTFVLSQPNFFSAVSVGIAPIGSHKWCSWLWLLKGVRAVWRSVAVMIFCGLQRRRKFLSTNTNWRVDHLQLTISIDWLGADLNFWHFFDAWLSLWNVWWYTSRWDWRFVIKSSGWWIPWWFRCCLSLVAGLDWVMMLENLPTIHHAHCHID